MNLGAFVSRIRRQMPSATVESISDAELWSEINLAVDECNRYAQVYKGYTEFSSVVGKQIYPLSQYVPNYNGISKDGCWYLVGTSLKELFPKTIRWLDLWIRNWKDMTNGEPQWYWVEGNDLGLYPKPATSSTLRIYHLLKATPMDNSNNYPWTNTTSEVMALQPMDGAIVAYVRWKISSAVGQPGQSDPLYSEYLREIKRAQTQIRRRPDIMSHWDSFVRIDNNA